MYIFWAFYKQIFADCDVFRFQNRFEDAIRTADNFPDNIPILINDVKTLLAKSETDWRKLLTTIRFTMPSTDEDSDTTRDTIVHESPGNSMLRFLLQNKHVQKPLFGAFFQEIRKRTKPENERELLDLVLIIRQMQFVNFQNNSDYIFNQYFEILGECNLRAREALIGGLDDFVELAKHSAAMEKIM